VRSADEICASELECIVKLVEEALESGDPTEADGIATGFLEQILSLADEQPEAVRKVVAMLGPEARAYCVAWDRFTGVRTPGL